MANNNYIYKHYEWKKIHSDIESKYDEIRTHFLEEKKKKANVAKVEILHGYLANGSLLSTVCVPDEEIAAVLQWFEVKKDTHVKNRDLVFDMVCNLWNFISDTDVSFFTSFSIDKQVHYFTMKKKQFLLWFMKEIEIKNMDMQVLMNAIHMPMYHRLAKHSTLELMICYLLC